MGINPENTGFNINLNAGRNVPKNSPPIPKKNVKSFEQVTRKEKEQSPSKRRDDAKKLGDSEEADIKEDFDGALSGGAEVASAQEAGSIFDIKKPEEEEITESSEEEEFIPKFSDDLKKESLSALFKGLGTKEKLLSLQKQVDSEIPEEASKFPREQTDIAAVNPLGTIQTSKIESNTPISTPQRSHMVEMQEMVDQIVSKLYILKVDGKTETTISLKHPPLFAGADVKVTGFDSARGEFNVTFENLSPDAKRMLDLAANQGDLRNALEQKGYVVHIITTTTTTIENAQGENANREKRDQQDDGRQKKRDQQEEQE